jgi:uncharacterized membrane protein
MKKSFITGLILLLPLVLTAMIVVFVVNLFTKPFIGVVDNFFQTFGLFQEGFLFLSAKQLQHLIAQVGILVALFFFIVLLGMIARWFVVHYLIRFGDFILNKIPFVNSIYKTSQDVIKTIFASETKSFKQVVLVPFPSPSSKSIGLVTKEEIEVDGKTRIAVFVPTTPNPTSGFLMLYERESLVWLDMTVEEAFKYVISCGVIISPFKTVSYKEAKELEKK